MIELQRQLRDLEARFERLEKADAVSFDPGATYAPTYLGLTTAGVTTYTTQNGHWIRLGSIIFVNGRVTWTAATGTGNAIISLPYTSQNTSTMEYSICVWINGVTFANSTPLARIGANQAFFRMDSPLTNAGVTTVAVEAAGDVIFSGWYCI